MTTSLQGGLTTPASPPDDVLSPPVTGKGAGHTSPHPGATPEPGVYAGVPMDVYHSWSAASNSRLSKLRRSPAHLRSYLDEPKKDTSALIIGRAAHTSILEPEDFGRLFLVAERCEAIKKSDSLQCNNMGLAIDNSGEWKCGQHGKGLALDPSRYTLDGDYFIACQKMRESIYARITSSALLTGPGEVELSVVWRDAATGVLCKARFDRLSTRFRTIADLKTTTDASEREFARSIYTYGYHRQGAFYLDGATAAGIEADHFAIIPVEKDAPFATATYRLTEGAIDAGRDQLRGLLALYAQCLETNTWPAYPDEVRDVSLPDYAWHQIEEEVAA